MNRPIRINLSHNEGSGFSDWIIVEEGTTLSVLFGSRLTGSSAKYRPGLRRAGAKLSNPGWEEVLQDGDEVFFTAADIGGA